MRQIRLLSVPSASALYLFSTGKIPKAQLFEKSTKLSNPNADRVEMAKSLLGVIPADITLDESRAERA